jgi:hypothetical protein
MLVILKDARHAARNCRRFAVHAVPGLLQLEKAYRGRFEK